MFDNPKFAQLVKSGAATGEVVGNNRFMIMVQGLGAIGPGAVVYFETGDQGFVREVTPTEVVVLCYTSEKIAPGTLVVLEAPELKVKVGDALVGRVISGMGQPLDGGGPIALTESAPIFGPAHSIIERQTLDTPLATGVMAVDMLFPFVLGQRIAVLGDSKTGKSSFLAQLTQAQSGTGRIVIHVLIAKRKADVDQLLNRLKTSGALAHSIVIVASIFDPLVQAYLAPYLGVTIAEHLWHAGKDVIILYDDLTSHAKVYRELSLLLRVPPGRDSYPGDMFTAHATLLERAGRLSKNGATLSAIPVMLTPNDDITAYLPTSVMSITDGQLIFDDATFRQGIRPAVNAGLSVSRVGGRGQTPRQKALTGALFKILAAYRQAAELSHFGSELAVESQAQLQLGKYVYEALKQLPETIYNPIQQILIMGAVVKSEGKLPLDINRLKAEALKLAPTITAEAAYDPAIAQLLQLSTIRHQAPAPAPPPPVPIPGAPS